MYCDLGTSPRPSTTQSEVLPCNTGLVVTWLRLDEGGALAIRSITDQQGSYDRRRSSGRIGMSRSKYGSPDLFGQPDGFHGTEEIPPDVCLPPAHAEACRTCDEVMAPVPVLAPR